MKNAYLKNIFRTIRNSMGRYLAILAIIALGVGFFSGLKVTKTELVLTANTYLKEHNMYDFKLLSTYGFTDREVEYIESADSGLMAEGSYNEDFIFVDEEAGGSSEYILKAYSMPAKVNTLAVRNGRLPQADNECVVDSSIFGENMIGKQLKISDHNSDDTLSCFKYDSYTVVGLVDSPLYFNSERGTTTIGDGKVDAFIFIPLESFEYECYKELFVKCDNNYEIYTDEYDTFIEEKTPYIEQLLNEVGMMRYEELQTNIDDIYDMAVAALEKEVKDAIRPQVEEEIRNQLVEEYRNQGLTEELIEASFDAGIFEVPQDIVEEKVNELAEPEIKALVEDIEITELDEPEGMIIDRSSDVGYVCYDNDTDIVSGVAKVFPVFFFLIAALVCSTTMTRMVDDERGQIGTLRALGYSNGAITSKYMIYSGSAAIIGCIGGFFGGCYLFPAVIWKAYHLLYDYGGTLEFYFSPSLLVICIVVSLICSMGATFFAVRSELTNMPSELIRPKAPAAGKRILLERVGFLWKHMKFLHKVTARNVFRFKKRMLMMIVGLSGCTALVLTGLGVRDSVTNLAEFQYDEIEVHDLEVTLSHGMTDELAKELEEKTEGFVTGYSGVYRTSVEYRSDDTIKTVILTVSAEADVTDYMNFARDGKKVKYPGYGEIMLTGKIASVAGVGVGDEITLTYNNREITLKVSGIYDNYVWHKAFITPETYEDYFGEEYSANTILVNTVSDDAAYESGAAISSLEGVMGVMVVPELKTRIANMMSMLNAVVWLVIGSAGALAFIVLFNLSNINISERVREIATIKVLGFYPGETGAYVFRENLVLTLMGIVVGLPLGVLLHSYVMNQINVDMIDFKTEIFPISYLLCTVIVLVFLKVVDLVMRKKIDKIDMAESLKSVE
ncbi:MAG: FtsX-like permease family protein [Wujia sp.]